MSGALVGSPFASRKRGRGKDDRDFDTDNDNIEEESFNARKRAARQLLWLDNHANSPALQPNFLPTTAATTCMATASSTTATNAATTTTLVTADSTAKSPKEIPPPPPPHKIAITDEASVENGLTTTTTSCNNDLPLPPPLSQSKFLPFHLDILRTLYNNRFQRLNHQQQQQSPNVDDGNGGDISTDDGPVDTGHWNLITRYIQQRSRLHSLNVKCNYYNGIYVESIQFVNEQVEEDELNVGSYIAPLVNRQYQRRQYAAVSSTNSSNIFGSYHQQHHHIMMSPTSFSLSTSQQSPYVARRDGCGSGRLDSLRNNGMGKIARTSSHTTHGSNSNTNTHIHNNASGNNILSKLLHRKYKIVHGRLEQETKQYESLVIETERRIKKIYHIIKQQKRSIMECNNKNLIDLLSVSSNSTSRNNSSCNATVIASNNKKKNGDNSNKKETARHPSTNNSYSSSSGSGSLKSIDDNLDDSISRLETKLRLWKILIHDLEIRKGKKPIINK